MRKWHWIVAGLLAIDLLVLIFAWPLLILIEGNHSELFWGVWVTRAACGIIGALLLVTLLAVWNIDYYFFQRKTKNPGA